MQTTYEPRLFRRPPPIITEFDEPEPDIVFIDEHGALPKPQDNTERGA